MRTGHRRDLPLPLGRPLRLLRPAGTHRTAQQRAQEGRGQSQERQPLSLLGLLGSGGVCPAIPARSPSILRAQASSNERTRRLPGARSQAGPRLLLHPERSGRLRPDAAVSKLTSDRNRPTREVLGARAHSGEWRRSRSVPIEEEQRRRAHAVSPQGAGAGSRASQPRDCRLISWTRPGTDDLLGQPKAVRGSEKESSLRCLDPDEWLVRVLRGSTPKPKKINRARNQLLETKATSRTSLYARRGKPCPLTREPSMSGTSSAPLQLPLQLCCFETDFGPGSPNQRGAGRESPLR